MNLPRIKSHATPKYPENNRCFDEIFLVVYHREVVAFVGKLVAASARGINLCVRCYDRV